MRFYFILIIISIHIYSIAGVSNPVSDNINLLTMLDSIGNKITLNRDYMYTTGFPTYYQRKNNNAPFSEPCKYNFLTPTDDILTTIGNDYIPYFSKMRLEYLPARTILTVYGVITCKHTSHYVVLVDNNNQLYEMSLSHYYYTFLNNDRRRGDRSIRPAPARESDLEIRTLISKKSLTIRECKFSNAESNKLDAFINSFNLEKSITFQKVSKSIKGAECNEITFKSISAYLTYKALYPFFLAPK